MAGPYVISLDAMSGDLGAEVVVRAAVASLDRHPDLELLLVGQPAELEALLSQHASDRRRLSIVPASEIVSMSEAPADALRRKKDSSMRVAINLVKDGTAGATVSAGNTGALMATAKFVLKMLPGIDRPAIIAEIPSIDGSLHMLDLGANAVCTAEQLFQFAVMGSLVAGDIKSIDAPRVALLNIGVEELKGNSAVKQAAQILQETPLPIRFYGFVEGNDIGAGTVDVIVTDGFTGNISLKTTEGTAHLFGHFLKEALNSSLLARIGGLLASPALKSFKQKVDPRRYNGAMFLGLNGICVKSHGGTDAVGFANAIKVAADMIAKGVNEGIKHDFMRLNEDRAAGHTRQMAAS